MTGKLKQSRLFVLAAGWVRMAVVGRRVRLACVFFLAVVLSGCASELTFDVPHDRVVTELRELYPSRMHKSARKGSKEQRKRWKELAHGAWSLDITHEESPSADRSMIQMEVVGHKYFWKRQMDITIHRLSEACTGVTVRCDYLQAGLFGYSRRRDMNYERQRLAEIRSRLEGQ